MGAYGYPVIEDLLSHQLSAAQESFLRKSIQGITIAAILFVSPFTIYHFLVGDYLIALFACLMLAVISYSVWNTLNGRLSYKLPFVLLTPAFLIFSWVAIEDLGVMGALWSFPAVTMFYFIFPERLARVANLVLLVVVLPRAFMELDTDIALRLVATLTGVSFMCSIFIRRLNSQHIELEETASIDPLTQLSNRLNLNNSLDRAIEYSQSRGYPMSILFVDLDGFRRINKALGYEKGDLVLQNLGGLLVGLVYSSDEIFRTGGEEFLILLNGSNPESAKQQAEKIHTALDQAKLAEGVKMTASIGVATLKPGETVYELLNRVDANFHAAKEAGGNCTQG
jgi:diguanylate cyclase